MIWCNNADIINRTPCMKKWGKLSTKQISHVPSHCFSNLMTVTRVQLQILRCPMAAVCNIAWKKTTTTLIICNLVMTMMTKSLEEKRCSYQTRKEKIGLVVDLYSSEHWNSLTAQLNLTFWHKLHSTAIARKRFTTKNLQLCWLSATKSFPTTQIICGLMIMALWLVDRAVSWLPGQWKQVTLFNM